MRVSFSSDSTTIFGGQSQIWAALRNPYAVSPSTIVDHYDQSKGTWLSGVLSDLNMPDGQSVTVKLSRLQAGTNGGNDVVSQSVVEGTAAGSLYDVCVFRFVGKVSSGTVKVTLEPYDWVSGSYSSGDSITSSVGSSPTVLSAIPLQPQNFVQSGRVRARITVRHDHGVKEDTFLFLDQCAWQLHSPD